MTTSLGRRSRSDRWVRLLVSILMTFLHAFLGALPIMWLTAFLADQGWAITPLGYWASYFASLMLGWIIDGAGTVRRAVDED